MLTRDQILALTAGPELDELIIEQVLGWRKVPLGQLREGTRYPDKIVWDTLKGPYADRQLGDFHPSLLLGEAWFAVHALRQLGWYSQHTEWWSWTFLNHAPPGNQSVSATAARPALAICQAALLVLLESPAPASAPLVDTEKGPGA